MFNEMEIFICSEEWKECLLLMSLISQTSLPVSVVTQVNTTVSPGHSISADDVSVTVINITTQLTWSQAVRDLPVAYDEQQLMRRTVNRYSTQEDIANEQW